MFSVQFWKDGKPWGGTGPAYASIMAAEASARAAMAVNGADAYTVHREGDAEAVVIFPKR